MKNKLSRMLSAALCSTLLLPVCMMPASGADAPFLTNLFPKTAAHTEGSVNLQNQPVTDANCVTSGYIGVSQGERIYFGAAPVDQSMYLITFDAEKNPTGQQTFPTLHERLNFGYAVFSFYVPADVKYIRVIAPKGVFDDGDFVVTRDQPFDKEVYHAYCNIPEQSDAVKNHPLYGKKALFLGDSHAAGSYDSAPSYRSPSKSWARQLALATGLVPTNAAVGGATISEPVSASDYIWVWDQFTAQKNKEFDVIFINGGGNDARRSRAIGEMLDTDDYETLHSADGTFAGGLQWLIYNVQDTWPEADVYYIASFRMDDAGTGNYRNIADYYDAAKQICERYGVAYVDLYDNDSLYEEFDYKDRKVMPDRLHPLADGYRIVGSYVVKGVNEILGFDPDAVSVPAVTEGKDMPETDTYAPETQPAAETPKKANWWPAAAIGAAVAAAGGVAAVILTRKKRR